MLSMEFILGQVIVTYRDNGLGFNQDFGWAKNPTDITDGAIWVQLKDNPAMSREEIYGAVADVLIFKRKECQEKLVQALKNVRGAHFYFLYEQRFYKCRKLSSLKRGVPMQFQKFLNADATNTHLEEIKTVAKRLERCIWASHGEYPEVPKRIRVHGRPYKFVWGRNNDPWDSPIFSKETLDEPIGG